LKTISWIILLTNVLMHSQQRQSTEGM